MKHCDAVKRVVKSRPLMAGRGVMVQEERSVNVCWISLNTWSTRFALFGARYGLSVVKFLVLGRAVGFEVQTTSTVKFVFWDMAPPVVID